MTSPDPIQPLLQDIIKWSQKSLPDWQRDALRRLFQRQSPELSIQDYDELYALLKKANGVDSTTLDPVPLGQTHVTQVNATTAPAVLKELRDLKNVNRIAPSQVLQFSHQGLTVIYGGNGSGKSGYTRVLKRACRARDQSESVLPDATDPTLSAKIPEATFILDLDGVETTVSWRLNQQAPDELATVAVFDARCARAFLTTEGVVDYIPYGLEILSDLAQKVIPSLERRLNDELANLTVDQTVLDPLRGSTKVGAIVEKFGPHTKFAEVEKLAELDQPHLARLDELKKALSVDDPLTAARKVRLEAQRFRDLAQRIDAAVSSLAPAEIETLRQLDAAYTEALKAVQLAADVLQSGENLLPGTGSSAWRTMFEAARSYSTEVAYPSHEFPHTGEGALCPLCQQNIQPAADRMHRFDAFLHQQTSRSAEEAKRLLQSGIQTFRARSILFDPDQALAAEITAHDPVLREKISAFQSAVSDRRDTIVANLSTHTWVPVSALENDPRPRLAELTLLLEAKAKSFEGAADADQRKAFMAELAELQARAQLKTHMSVVSRLHQNMVKRAALELCRKQLQTKTLSTQIKTFTDVAVTATLRTELDSEFARLGGVPFKLGLSDRAEKGKTKYKLRMEAPSTAKLDEILSEGEQRAVAIGSFLAELALVGHKGPIVFDDPVSSLDHQRKRKIAERLAHEARDRQVVVFTHDLVFLSELQNQASAATAVARTHWLQADRTGRPGHVTLDNTPTATKDYLDTKLARASLKRAVSLSGEEQADVLAKAAAQLRTTLETVVQQHLFKDVISRWRENLMLTKIRQINWDNTLADEIFDLFGELSRYMVGHSHSEV